MAKDFDYQNCGAYFIGPKADLRDVNLKANLKGVGIKEAIYDERTEWPEGFSPVIAGAILRKD